MPVQVNTSKVVGARCPSCHSKMKLALPSKAGRLVVTCPSCKKQFYQDIPQSIIDKYYPKQEEEKKAEEDASSQDNTKGNGQGQQEHKTTDPRIHYGSSAAILVMKRLLLPDKKFKLRVGANTIGRTDEEQSSDIMVNDRTMSRQSATITVQQLAENQYKYFFTVNHCTNPVLVNGKESAAGSSFELLIGDEFQLGLTKFVLKPAK